MKKMMYLAPLAALALAACSSDSVVENTANPAAQSGDQLVINPLVAGATRGTVTTDANLTEFYVKAEGSDAFLKGSDATEATAENSEITGTVKKGTDGKWEFDGLNGSHYYWPSKNATATFAAYAPATYGTNRTVTVESTVSDQKDIIVAYNSGAASKFTAGVPLNFQHVMSQIVIKALNKDAASFKVEVAGAKLTQIKNKGTLADINVATAAPFDWTTYTPWTVDVTSYEPKYIVGSTSADATGATTLTASAAQIGASDGAFILMPQQLTAVTNLQEIAGSVNPNGSYLSVLIRATDLSKTVGEIDEETGQFLTADGTKIPFDGKKEGSSTNDTYQETTYNNLLAGQKVTIESTEYEPKNINPVTYPCVGYGNNSTKFAYVCVPIDTEWKPGYKYTYTLNFSKEGIGKIDPIFAEDASALTDYPGGTGGLQPGEDIVDNPIELFFTVTVDSWADADAISQDM